MRKADNSNINSENIFFYGLLPVLTGILLGISALPSKIWVFNFISFIPLLIAAEKSLLLKRPLLSFISQLFVALIVFYIWTGHWVLQTANMGFLLGLIVIVPFIILVAPYILLKKWKNKFAPVYFVVAWLTAELIQSYFQLGSPFFNLGHSIGKNPKFIQWYEFTGTSGGTLWVLAVNISFFSLVKTFLNNENKWQSRIIVLSGIIIIPMVISIYIYWDYEEKGTLAEVMVVHPSTDNTNVKYRKNIYELMDIYLDIVQSNLTEKTDYVVLPETAITNTGWISDYPRNLVFQRWFKKIYDYPSLKLVTGAIAYEEIPNVKKINGYKKIPGIRYSKNYKTWYYTYNAALFLEIGQAVQFRVKDKLVPYQEYAPYPRFIPRLKPVGIDFQFSTKRNNREVFISKNGSKSAALICYELVYSAQFFNKAREGAEAFFVLLNEGWYNNPKVPQQFLQLSSIRAIENRRCIAHSSNMGISAFINQKGEIVKRIESKQAGYLNQQIRLNKNTTLYTTTGNFIGIVAIMSMLGCILTSFINYKTKKKTKSIH